MNTKTFYLLIILSILASASIGYLYFLKPNVNISTASTEISINAEELAKQYFKNHKKANKLYQGKVIEVHGIVKEITFLNKTNTIILQGDHKNNNILCDINLDSSIDIHSLSKGQKVIIKGICKGFLHDVILLNCMLTNTINNE